MVSPHRGGDQKAMRLSNFNKSSRSPSRHGSVTIPGNNRTGSKQENSVNEDLPPSFRNLEKSQSNKEAKPSARMTKQTRENPKVQASWK